MDNSSGGKVLIGVSSFGATDEMPLHRLRSARLHVVPNPFGRRLAKQELRALLSDDVVGLIAGLETIDREVLTHSRLNNRLPEL